MGYLRLWRRKTLVPGLRMNLSKSGVSWSLGPRGAHFTVGTRGARTTVGLPGTGIYYTSYSAHHAHRATQRRASQRSPTPPTTEANAVPAQPRAHREPWLPVTKIVFGVGFIVLGLATIAAYVGVILVIVGTIYLVVGLAQRGQPAWRIRTLLRRAHRRPSEAPRFLTQALAVDPDNPEALAANADWEFDHQEWAKAAELFERYLAHAPQDWLAEGHAGNAWLNAGNADAAIPHLSRVRELPQLTDGGRASITAGLAMAYLRKGNAHQALDIARSEPLQRHKLEDGLQQCLFVRALAYYESGQHSHAITDLDRLASINPAYQNLNEVRNEMLTGSFQLQAIAAPPTTADSTATTP